MGFAFYSRRDAAQRVVCSVLHPPLPVQAVTEALLTQTELLDDRTVTSDIGLLEVCEKVSSVTDHLEKAATAVVILVVRLHVFGQIVDAVGQECNLNLGRTGVSLVHCVLLDDSLLCVLVHCGFHLSKIINY